MTSLWLLVGAFHPGQHGYVMRRMVVVWVSQGKVPV
jgi:hypothetical protein